MSQSSVIVGALIIAFLMYITRKGELPVYAGLLLLSPPSSGTQTASASNSSSSSQAQSTATQIGGELASQAALALLA